MFRLLMLLPPLLGLCATNVFADTIRIATFNVAMGLEHDGALATRLAQEDDADLAALAEVLQRVRPDVALLNEFDFSPGTANVAHLREHYLSVAQQPGLQGIDYPYFFSAPVNTGVDSTLDLDGDGELHGPGDAWGFGRFPGQYGMLVLSRFPVDTGRVRTFQHFPWQALEDAARPAFPDGRSFYDDDTWAQLRLSSKSHWDLPIQAPGGTIHLLASHPTPPVFDGPEDRNGARNRDEIRFWAHYIQPGPGEAFVDDAGHQGGLTPGATWVVAGDLNADPHDGASQPGGIDLFLEGDWVNHDCTPASAGGVEAAATQGGANAGHQGNPAHDTADFNDRYTGNLRADYVLTGRATKVVDCGVFWPRAGEPGHEAAGFSDHRLVWIDLSLDTVTGSEE